jgi:rRNA maturation endonuclease Nob1
MTTTNYIIYKKCVTCFAFNQKNTKSCHNCGYLFMNEATEKEQKKAEERFLSRFN